MSFLNKKPISMPLPPLPKLKEHKGRRTVRPRECGGMLCNVVFWIWHGYHTQELKTPMVTCTRSVPDNNNLNSSIDGSDHPSVFSLSGELLAV